MKHLHYLMLFLVALIIISCKPDFTILDERIPEPLDNINSPLRYSDRAYAIISQELNISQDIDVPLPVVPAHLALQNSVRELTETQMRRAVLGRVLFYDTRLSATGETSCASCHNQETAFADGKRFSEGIRGAQTTRNSFALGGVPSFLTPSSDPELPAQGYYSPPPTPNPDPTPDAFFWDGRASSIIAQARETMSSPIEMGTDLETVAAKLSVEPLYQVLALKAYRRDHLTVGDIIQSIGDFMSTMSSTDSRFDDFYDRKATGATEADLLSEFTEAELRGAAIFEANCTTCHGNEGKKPNINLANNGLDVFYTDLGNGAVSGDRAKIGFFKTPFIRNLPYSAPYMHDGRFATLREVVDHYSDGVADHENLSNRLRNGDGSVKLLRLSEADKEALVDFLEMTGDRTIRTAEHLSDPFLR